MTTKYGNSFTKEEWMLRNYPEDKAKAMAFDRPPDVKIIEEGWDGAMGDSGSELVIRITGLRRSSYHPTDEDRALAKHLLERIKLILQEQGQARPADGGFVRFEDHEQQLQLNLMHQAEIVKLNGMIADLHRDLAIALKAQPR